MTQPNSVIKAVAKYDKSNIQGLYIKLHKTKDKDIIDKLETVESKQGYIKKLIREDNMDKILTDILDKIRADIEALKNAPSCFDDMFEYKCAVDDVLDIIDKYKTENE